MVSFDEKKAVKRREETSRIKTHRSKRSRLGNYIAGTIVFLLGVLWIPPMLGLVDSQDQFAQRNVPGPKPSEEKTANTNCAQMIHATRRSCEFSNTLTWVSTGKRTSNTDALCLERLPTPDDYTLYYRTENPLDEPRLWVPGTKGVAVAYGFQAPKDKTRLIQYGIAKNEADCSNL